MKTSVQNHQQAARLSLPAIRKLTAGLAAKLEAADPSTTWDEVTLLLTGDEGIRQYNREFFGKDRPTDVISFRCEALPGEEGATGDLIVNVEQALREGPRHDGIQAELALYIAHGFDHLSGADDNTPARRAAMRRTERAWLKQLEPLTKTLITGQMP